MPPFESHRRVLAAAGLALTLAACAEPPAPAPPPAAPPPPAPAVSLSPRLVEQAAAYRRYVQEASSISPAFQDGGQVAQAVRAGVAYEPHQLLRGAVAYGAVAALQDAAFVASVRAQASDPMRRQAVVNAIHKDPAYVLGFDGAASAAGLTMNAIGGDGQRLLTQGWAVKQAAYDVQHSAWSKRDVVGRDARLLAAKQLSATPILADTDETARLQQAVTSTGSLGLAPQSASPPYGPLVVRSLAVAGLAALGQAGEASVAHVMPMLAEPASANCLNLSKLNLYQCLAVSRPHYEDVFCLGQHVLIDTGRCMLKGAGVTAPPEPPITRLTSASGAKSPPTKRSTARR